jgi:hypothetical protein
MIYILYNLKDALSVSTVLHVVRLYLIFAHIILCQFVEKKKSGISTYLTAVEAILNDVLKIRK